MGFLAQELVKSIIKKQGTINFMLLIFRRVLMIKEDKGKEQNHIHSTWANPLLLSFLHITFS